MTPDFSIVTAVTPDYVKKLRWTLPTWSIKPQFKDRVLYLLHNGFVPSGANNVEQLAWVRDAWPMVVFCHWQMPAVSDQRERMLSSFVLATPGHVTTDYFVKLDADCYFTDDQDVFLPEDFDADLCAHRWGYTKPGWWIDKLDKWIRNEEYDGDMKDIRRRDAKRIISFCCLHKTQFVRDAAELAGSRLPVPSHDTYLWYLASKLKDVKFLRPNLKARGVDHCHRWRGLRENVCAGGGVWNDYHSAELMSKVQLEVTTACNMRCPNCDRNCGQAPSDEHMTIDQMRKFHEETKATGHHWERVDIIGGEPTIHPQFSDMLKLFTAMHCDRRETKWRLTTNGSTSPDFHLYPWLSIRCSAEEKKHPVFEAVNVAPRDLGIQDAKACSIPWRCGMALTRYGYFLCGAGASIARVFGLDIGIKNLADVTPEAMRAQRNILCQLCGHSASARKTTDRQETSKSWEEAFKHYREFAERMTLY